METKKVLLHIKENISLHKQKYLDWDAVEYYWLLEKIYETKELEMSLRKEYGVTEVEAINILNHKRTNIDDYIVKYTRMQCCDEKKEYLLRYLLQLELPDVLEDKQIKNLKDCFIYRKYDKELTNIEEKDKELWRIDFIYGLLID